MKFLVAVAFLAIHCAVALPAWDEHVEDVSGAVPSENSKDFIANKREKRTLGVDEANKKDWELKTSHGASLKVSKSYTFNDGGAIIHLPTLIDTIGNNKVKVIEAKGAAKRGGAVAPVQVCCAPNAPVAVEPAGSQVVDIHPVFEPVVQPPVVQPVVHLPVVETIVHEPVVTAVVHQPAVQPAILVPVQQQNNVHSLLAQKRAYKQQKHEIRRNMWRHKIQAFSDMAALKAEHKAAKMDLIHRKIAAVHAPKVVAIPVPVAVSKPCCVTVTPCNCQG